MTNTERVIAYLRSIAPNTASNADICSGTRISPHAQVFQITRAQMNAGVIKGRQFGREWQFSLNAHSNEISSRQTSLPEEPAILSAVGSQKQVTAIEFERLAETAMSRYFGVSLRPGRLPHIPKTFDFVSGDQMTVGDAKFYTLVNGTSTPPAKFSVIAEYIWLLERVPASTRFLVFGNDVRVPQRWLQTYATLKPRCDFYFLTSDARVEILYQAERNDSVTIIPAPPDPPATS